MTKYQFLKLPEKCNFTKKKMIYLISRVFLPGLFLIFWPAVSQLALFLHSAQIKENHAYINIMFYVYICIASTENSKTLIIFSNFLKSFALFIKFKAFLFNFLYRCTLHLDSIQICNDNIFEKCIVVQRFAIIVSKRYFHHI